MNYRHILSLSLVVFSAILNCNAQISYKYGLSHKLILTDFISSKSEKKLNFSDLPRGMEFTFSEKINKTLFFQIPLRTGFSKGSSDTTKKPYFGADLQIMFEKPFGSFFPFISTGISTQFLSSQTDLGIPLAVGANFKIEDGFYLSIQTSYRQSFQSEKSSWVHGAGITFRFGSVKDKKNTILKTNNINTFDSNLILSITKIESEKNKNPWIIKDRDGDGVVDTLDRCPLQKGEMANWGCPDTSNENYGKKYVANVKYDDTLKTNIILASNNEISLSKDINNIHYPSSQPELIDKIPTDSRNNYTDLNIQNITFEINKNKLGQVGFNILDSVVQYLNFYPAANLKIQGHTDNTGSIASNQILSVARAKICFDYFVNKGIESKRLLLIGFGEDSPLFDNSTLLGRSKNRRVEFMSFLLDK